MKRLIIFGQEQGKYIMHISGISCILVVYHATIIPATTATAATII